MIITKLFKTLRVPGEEESELPALFLRFRSCAAGDPGPGVRFAHHPKPLAFHLR